MIVSKHRQCVIASASRPRSGRTQAEPATVARASAYWGQLSRLVRDEALPIAQALTARRVEP